MVPGGVERRLNFTVWGGGADATIYTSENYVGTGKKVLIVAYRNADKLLRMWENGNLQTTNMVGVINPAVSNMSALTGTTINSILGEHFVCPAFADTPTANLYGKYLAYRAGTTWIDVP